MPTKKAKKITKKTAAKKAVQKTSKKATKKSTVKKESQTARKSTSKKSADKKPIVKKKKMVKARGPACFWTRDGLILESLVTLSNALKSMSEEEFYYHVTKDRNDFADWVEQILEDAECAAALRKSRKPNTAATVVVKHLRYYKI